MSAPMPPLQGLTSAMGDALSEFAGFLATRLTTLLLPEQTIATGINSAESADLGVTIELTTGTFAAGVANGHRFRVLTGALAGQSALVLSRVDDDTITLAGSGLGANFAGASWEIVLDAEATAEVETTVGFSDAGELFIDGVRYRYTGREVSPARFTGLSHFDSVDWIAGVARRHEPMTEVFDYTRAYSELDKVRRSILLRYATGPELDVIGRNLGVPRPPELQDDEVYRRLVEATAYTHRGTMRAIELALDALLGAGNYETFEDLTSHPIHNTATVFIRRDDANATEAAGKTFLDGEVPRPLTAQNALSLDEDAITIAGVRLLPEPGPLGRLIDTGAGVTVTSGLTAVLGDPGTFSDRIKRGDIFVIESGPLRGHRATIAARVSDGELTLGPVPGVSNYPLPPHGTKGIAYRVVRDASHFRFYKPSEEVYTEYDSDPGTTVWTFVGDDEAADVEVIADEAGHGDFLELRDAGGADTATYEHPLRIQPESYARVQFHLTIPSTSSTDAGANAGLQFAIRLRDGEREINLGVIKPDTDLVDFVPVLDDGSAIPGAGAYTASVDTWVTIEFEKRGRDVVRFYADGVEFAAVDYADFTDISGAPDWRLSFGLFDGTLSGMRAWIKHADWRVTTARDYWNLHVPSGLTNAPRELVDNDGNGHFTSADEGRRLRIHDFTAMNAAGGTARGEWVIDEVTGADTLLLVGPSHGGATMNRAAPARITIRGAPWAFSFPDALGHQIVIETGPNAGTYTIARLLDPVTFADLIAAAPETYDLADYDPTTGAAGLPFQAATHVIEVSDPPVGGFAADADATWHLVPVFADDVGPVPFEVVGRGVLASGTDLTLPADFPITRDGDYPLVGVEYSRVLSAQVLDEKDSNTQTTLGVYSHYPFYLADNFGFIRRVIDALTVAGVIPDFDRFFRDEAGPHIL